MKNFSKKASTASDETGWNVNKAMTLISMRSSSLSLYSSIAARAHTVRNWRELPIAIVWEHRVWDTSCGAKRY